MIESAMFRYYGPRRQMGEKDGGMLEQAHGCNGTRHVDSLMVVYYDATYKVLNATSFMYVEVGSCDGSCGNITLTPSDGTSFLYPLDTVNEDRPS